MYHEYIFTWYIFSQIRVKLIKKYYSFFLQPTYLQANNLISFYRYLQSVISQVALSFLNIFEEFFSGCTLQQFKLSFCDVGFSRSSIPKYFVFIIMFLILSCCDRFTKICSIIQDEQGLIASSDSARKQRFQRLREFFSDFVTSEAQF